MWLTETSVYGNVRLENDGTNNRIEIEGEGGNHTTAFRLIMLVPYNRRHGKVIWHGYKIDTVLSHR